MYGDFLLMNISTNWALRTRALFKEADKAQKCKEKISWRWYLGIDSHHLQDFLGGEFVLSPKNHLAIASYLHDFCGSMNTILLISSNIRREETAGKKATHKLVTTGHAGRKSYRDVI